MNLERMRKTNRSKKNYDGEKIEPWIEDSDGVFDSNRLMWFPDRLKDGGIGNEDAAENPNSGENQPQI